MLASILDTVLNIGGAALGGWLVTLIAALVYESYRGNAVATLPTEEDKRVLNIFVQKAACVGAGIAVILWWIRHSA